MPITAILDARPDRIDLRDKQYSPPLRSLEPVFPSPQWLEQAVDLYLEHDMILDQGEEGACTGFGLAATVNYLCWRRKVIKRDASGAWKVNEKADPPAKASMRMLYHLARFYDEWPGEDYEGSSCRGAVKAWYKHGVCSDETWPYRHPRTERVIFMPPSEHWREDAANVPLGVYYRIEKDSVTDMQAAIQEVGAIFCSAMVHKGWSTPKKSRGQELSHQTIPVITYKPDDDPTGGHAFALVGYNELGFVVQNSWGEDWGHSGFAILTYDDWVNNGSDAWVCVLGAKTSSAMPDHYYSSDLTRGREFLLNHPILHSLAQPAPCTKPQESIWTEGTAYQHSVVMGNDGKVINRLVDQQGGRQCVRHIVLDNALSFFKSRPNSKPRILIYAHGGLNSEGDSLERIKVLGPYLRDNDIYPVFFSWRTGLLESVGSILADATSRILPWQWDLGDFLKDAKRKAAEALDRTLEVACENLGVKAVWSQMKQNAAAASLRANQERGVFLTTLALAELKKQLPELEIHLVGHSAGSIILGHMLDDFPRNHLGVSSCTLFAPACTIDFAIRHYQKSIEDRKILDLDDFHIHLLIDRRERDDTVGPYRKSLLYLVSRALEGQHKTPLLGMETSFDADKARKGLDYDHWHRSTLSSLQRWQSFWGDRTLHRVGTEEITTVGQWRNGKLVEKHKTIDAAHGSFDNDVIVVDQTLCRILGQKKLTRPITNLDY